MRGHVTCLGCLVLLVCLMLAAPSAQATVHDIQVGNNFFSPLGTTVQYGDTVRWTWDGGIPHSVTSEVDSPKSFDSGIESTAGFVFQIEIQASDGPGPFPYFCQVHASTMKDTIYVANPLVVPPGVDLYMLSDDGGSGDSTFATDTIPADFFDPGSDPFIPWGLWQGDQLSTTPSGVLDPASIAVARLDPMSLEVGETATVPVEIVALSLRSVDPVTVTYNGGQDPETWDVRVVLSGDPQPVGGMDVTRGCEEGGTFDLSLPVHPKFIFTPVDPPGSAVRIFIPPTPLQLHLADSANWVTAPVPFVNRVESDGTAAVDHDADPGTPDIPMPPTNFEFFVGPSPLDCIPEVPPVCFGLPLILLERATDPTSQLRLLPAVTFVENVGAAELPDGSCVITTELCALDLGGTYAGDGTQCFGLPPIECCAGDRGNVDASPDEQPTLGDLTVMVDHLFIGLEPLECWEEGNVDESIPEGPGSVTLSDLTVLIDHLFISLAPLPPCP
ncbi:hypothetical protein GF377_07010 [candidate division GN15 bacterium]|nr:hypothetical protein [candidate division GN15 bacterium]